MKRDAKPQNIPKRVPRGRVATPSLSALAGAVLARRAEREAVLGADEEE